VAEPRAAYRKDVEGLRAVAVILVVLNHLLAVPAGGFIGVDLFFVISGFVITGMLWREGTARTFTFRGFYLRRVRRLLPSAVLVLLATNLAAQFFFYGPRVQQTRTDTLWALGFLANVHMARTDTDYFHANDAPSLLQHYWSLAVEEQFYVVWPLVLVLLVLLARRKASGALALPLALLVTALSFGYALHLVSIDPARAYFSSPARAWELGVGALLGLLVSWGLHVPERLQQAFGWAGVALLGYAAFYIDPTQPFPGYAALVPVAAGVSLILAGTGWQQPWVTRLLSHQVTGYVGRISYPVYLWHWPVIVISEEVWGRNSLVWVAAPFVSVMLAVLTHHLVEEPLRGRVSPREAYRQLLPTFRGSSHVPWVPLKNFAIGSMAYVLVLTSIAISRAPMAAAGPATSARSASSGTSKAPLPADYTPAPVGLARDVADALQLTSWPRRFTPSLEQLDAARAPQWVHDGCLNVTASNLARCRFGSPQASHHAALMGDSIAISYLPGILRALEPLGWDFQLLTQAGCNNAVSVLAHRRPDTACDAHRNWALTQVQHLRPELLILSNVPNTANISPAAMAGSPLETWRAGLELTLARSRPWAKHVAIMSAPPTLANLQTCLTRFNSPRDCERKVSHTWDETRFAEEQAASDQHAAYILTVNWFCFQGYCPAIVGDNPVTADGVHLTAAYSERLAPAMAEAFEHILAAQ
jgi:peptidoglycan/LPS O-acetylase OafA/YrhL